MPKGRGLVGRILDFLIWRKMMAEEDGSYRFTLSLLARWVERHAGQW